MKNAILFKAKTVLAVLSIMLIAGGLPASAQRADPDRLAAAKEMLVAIGAAENFDTVVPLISKQLQQTFTKMKPEHSQEIQEAFKRIPEKFSARKQELLDEIAVLYAQQLTVEELKQIAAFYQGPVGKKFAKTQSGLAQQSMMIGRAWGQKIGLEIQQEIREELKHRGVEL